MENTSHLHRMAQELKCPICLSLLKSAVSLTCNHIFCNVCIDKSMKADSTCPVCKIPYQRREIRPAPHMDTLVSIYKSMEVSSGVNILVTQTEPQAAGNENQIEDETVGGSKMTIKACSGMSNTQKQKKNKGKTSKGSLKRPKRSISDIERPSFPTKKRIQVPQHPPQETPTRPANPEAGKSELIKDRTQTNASGPEGTAELHENGETLFSPFFWLRNEEDAEKTTQLTPFDPVDGSPPGAICFSDIKDSADQSFQLNSKDVNMFDSEIFEWTQKPCSPELCTSPMKMQDNEFDGCDRVRENEHNNMVVDKETDNMEVVLPILAPLQINKVDHEAKVKGSKKRAKKTTKNIQMKRIKRGTNKLVETCTVPLKTNQDKDINTSVSVKCKKQNHKRGKKVDGEASILGNGSTVGLAISLNLPKGNIHNANGVDKKKKETTNKQHIKRSKNQNPRNNNDNNNSSIAKINKDFISPLPSEPSLVDSETNICASRKQTEKGQVSNKLKTSKKVVSFVINEGCNVNSVDVVSTTSVKDATKTTQPLREVRCSSTSKKETNHTGKPNAMFLHKCETMSNICCAFCHSTEESNISGCMTHYLKGKRITLGHEGVLRAIHAHSNCTEWAPNVYFEDGIAVNLEAELTRSKRIKCSCCGLKGAALGCYEKSCRKSFHFTCAKLTPQCRWDDVNFVMLCPLHAFQKLPNETYGSQQIQKKKFHPKRQANIKQSQVPVDNTVSTISHWDSRELFAKIVLCCSALTSIEKETIAKFEKLSGIMILKTWDSRVTHVIASVDENGACRRTLKYLMGILEGKWILSIEWIKACLEVKKPVDELLYEINLDIHGFKGGPKTGRFRLLNKEPKLLNDSKFYFTGDFVASYKGYLYDLIIAAGGTVLHRKPIPINNEQQFLIYCTEFPDKLKAKEQNLILSKRKSEAEALAKSCGAIAVSNSWILNSIAACKLQNLE